MQIKVIPVGPIQTNCYILIDEAAQVAAMIDPGDDWEILHNLVGKLGVELQYILLTHGHYDHTTAVPELHKQYPNAKIYIHKADANGAGSHLFPLAGQIENLNYYDEGDTLTLGELTPHPRSLPRQRSSEGGRRPLLRRHPLCRLLRPHRPAGRKLRGDYGLSEAVG